MYQSKNDLWMNNKGTKYGIILLLLILALTGANLLFGSVNIPAEAVWHILTGNEVEKARIHRGQVAGIP